MEIECHECQLCFIQKKCEVCDLHIEKSTLEKYITANFSHWYS